MCVHPFWDVLLCRFMHERLPMWVVWMSDVQRVSPSEALARSLAAIGTREADVLAFELLDTDRAATEARRLDDLPRKGPLHGVPVAVKDVIDVAGLPTRCGTPLRASDPPASADASVVRALRAAGAVVVGKTVTTEFAYFAPGVTRNPHDFERSPGGSSSGSAAAVAAGMVPLAVGTQTAGSTTRPASFCGIAGLATSRGSLDRSGVLDFSRTLDVLGFFTSAVADLEPVSSAVGLPTAPAPTGRILVAELGDLAAAHSSSGLSVDMLMAVRSTVESLPLVGLKPQPLPDGLDLAGLVDSQKTVMAFEAAQSLSAESRSGALSPQLQMLLDKGTDTPKADYDEALAAASSGLDAFQSLIGDADCVLAPATLDVAPLRSEETTGDPLLSRPWHLLGLPALTVPGHLSPDGLPLGIQLIGRPGEERRLIKLGVLVEKAIRAASP
jgi:Asp-tRNA(Asn)/Glu-tRNA(Gln) amidotransferase A subunit family amidase